MERETREKYLELLETAAFGLGLCAWPEFEDRHYVVTPCTESVLEITVDEDTPKRCPYCGRKVLYYPRHS